MDLLSYGEGTPPARGPKASEDRLFLGLLRDPHFRVAKGDRDRFQVVQAERVGALPTIRRLVGAGDGHVVERALLPLVLPNARGNAAAPEFLDRLRFEWLIVRCH